MNNVKPPVDPRAVRQAGAKRVETAKTSSETDIISIYIPLKSCYIISSDDTPNFGPHLGGDTILPP
jgi:hypothetical protein